MTQAPAKLPESLRSVLRRNLIFVGGKGGVGKSLVAQAVARALASEGRKTLWVSIEDPLLPPGELKKVTQNLWHLNCEASSSFEEYAAMKIGGGALTKIFLQNKLMRYLSKAAPGIHELVITGKIWHERQNYQHVVVDMPSTGYGLAMFQSTINFSRLFTGGPINRDAESMLATFASPRETGQLIVSLPEEMPLQESIELNDYLLKLFPQNAPAFLVNRRFPEVDHSDEDPDTWTSPLPLSALDYARKRSVLENFNLDLWKNHKIEYGELDYVPPRAQDAAEEISQRLADQLRARDYL